MTRFSSLQISLFDVRYLFSAINFLFYFVDFISTIPVDLIFFMLVHNNSCYYWLRLPPFRMWDLYDLSPARRYASAERRNLLSSRVRQEFRPHFPIGLERP